MVASKGAGIRPSHRVVKYVYEMIAIYLMANGSCCLGLSGISKTCMVTGHFRVGGCRGFLRSSPSSSHQLTR